MLKKFIIPFSIAALLVACGSDSNSSSATDDSSPNNKGSGSCPKDGSGDDTSCSFKKECDTWASAIFTFGKTKPRSSMKSG